MSNHSDGVSQIMCIQLYAYEMADGKKGEQKDRRESKRAKRVFHPGCLDKVVFLCHTRVPHHYMLSFE